MNVCHCSSSPSPDLLNAHISKLITENQAMIFDADWAATTVKRETPSPPRNGTSPLGLLPYAVPHMEPEDLSLTTSEPLNLVVKEPRKRSLPSPLPLPHTPPRKEPDLSRITEEILYPCPYCKVVFRTSDYLNTHLFSCKPKSSPGPLLGRTPLIDSFNCKKRKLDLNKLECAKRNSLKLFGGEVRVLDSESENRTTVRLEMKECPQKDSQVLTFAKTGLNAVGGTIVQSETQEKVVFTDKLVLPISIPSVATPTLKVPGISTPVQVTKSNFDT